MRRMVIFWCVCIGIVVVASILQPAWSLNINPWTVNVLILLVLLLFIELGLVHYRSRMADLSDLLQQSRTNLRNEPQEEHYIAHTRSKD